MHIIVDIGKAMNYNHCTKTDTRYTGACGLMQVKRETGENPVQSRCCVRGVAVQNHWHMPRRGTAVFDT